MANLVQTINLADILAQMLYNKAFGERQHSSAPR